jgi:hypothetical protein
LAAEIDLHFAELTVVDFDSFWVWVVAIESVQHVVYRSDAVVKGRRTQFVGSGHQTQNPLYGRDPFTATARAVIPFQHSTNLVVVFTRTSSRFTLGINGTSSA